MKTKKKSTRKKPAVKAKSEKRKLFEDFYRTHRDLVLAVRDFLGQNYVFPVDDFRDNSMEALDNCLLRCSKVQKKIDALNGKKEDTLTKRFPYGYAHRIEADGSRTDAFTGKKVRW